MHAIYSYKDNKKWFCKISLIFEHSKIPSLKHTSNESFVGVPFL